MTISILELLQQERLEPNEPIVIRRRDSVIEGKITPEGKIRVGTIVHASPSGAAKIEMGVKAVDGWKVWRVPRLNFSTLDQVRTGELAGPKAEPAARAEKATRSAKRADKAAVKKGIDERAAARKASGSKKAGKKAEPKPDSEVVEDTLRIPLTSKAQEVLVDEALEGLDSGRIGHVLVVPAREIDQVVERLQNVEVEGGDEPKAGSAASAAHTLLGKFPAPAQAPAAEDVA